MTSRKRWTRRQREIEVTSAVVGLEKLMPVTIEKGQFLADWAREKGWRPPKSPNGRATPTACLNIALVNNMPDSALEDTESQFSSLLGAAAGDIPVCLRFYSLPGIARSDRARQRLSELYFGIDDLLGDRFDGVIVTGTEPRRPDLRTEPYWSGLVDILDWAERNTSSAVLSCLAAHAGVLHSDGIERHALGDKRFGVFDELTLGEDALTHSAGPVVRFPHSRWNEVREDELVSAGYTILTKSKEAGVNLFVKRKGESLFVHFQGHPEYGVDTLLKEYRRDIGRFLRGERETYPAMPREYFDAESARLLNDFQEKAENDPHKTLLAEFPERASVLHSLQKTWHSPAVCIYRNWLRYVASKRTETSTFASTAQAGRR